MALHEPDLAPLLLASTPLVERALSLISIPAVLVTRSPEGFGFEAFNMAYRRAGLGTTPEKSALIAGIGARIDAFLETEQRQTIFAWAVGDAVDTRHYQVTVARASSDRHDRCLVSLVDHTSELRTERSLRREMTTDSLTGLLNRAGFSDLLESVMDQRAAHAVLVIDLDRFSRVNACLGSLAGDELLITVARRIKGALRSSDTIGRTGGDEFGILMAIDDRPDEAEEVAARIRRALMAPFRLTDYEITVDCSIGVAFGSPEVDDAEELIRHAQFAVKRAKATGRTEAYQLQAFTAAREKFGMETALRRAIENGELRLAYQPICDLASGRIVAFESLARWRDESGQEFQPADFIPVAEESGLIVPLGRWAIDEAATTLAGWDVAAGGHSGVKIAVNLSAIQLHRDAIAPVVERALSETGLSGDRFTLELTESALVTDPDGIAATMRALKDLGTTLAMDDFGTGYSNLAYLQKLPIDILKIDRSFVTGMLADRDKIAIVRAILSLAQALGMQTTAEGIETNELAQTLAALGCTFGQGFLYARPLEADKAYEMIAPPSI